MKTIQFRRHSIKQGPGDVDLSEKGVLLAKEVGKKYLRGQNFDLVFVSSLKRTLDTAIGFMDGAGDFPKLTPHVFQPGIEVGGTEKALRLWSGVCNKAEHAGEDMLRVALDEEAAIARGIATRSAASFRVWLTSIPEGTKALVVGHSPFMELMVYGLFGEILTQLNYCEGFEITETDGELHLHRLPPL